MDEVDNIIIDTLKALSCNISEDITSLKQFDNDLVVLSVSTCLEAIIPSSKFPKKLPYSMAGRLKTASHLAEQIKDIGFTEEIGYQTILYFNEVEIRRLLIFLVEKLPKESENSDQPQEVGYIPKLLNSMKTKLKSSSSWVSPSVLERGMLKEEDTIDVRSFGNSSYLKSKKLKIPSSITGNDKEEVKAYCVHILPVVTKQCTQNELIPSLLFDDYKFSKGQQDMLSYLKSIPNIRTKNNDISNITKYDDIKSEITNESEQSLINKESIESESYDSENYSVAEVSTEKPNTFENLKYDLEEQEKKLRFSIEALNKNRSFVEKLQETKDNEEKILQKKLHRLEIMTKTNAILSQEENLQKLKFLVDKAKQKIVKLAEQWKEVQNPLLEEYNSLKNTSTESEKKLQEKKTKVKNIVKAYNELLNDLKQKVELEQQLAEKLKQSPKNTNRSTYTKNIMEIINNIKKQNHEMQKILKDTKEVQRDINSLTGQIDRSFTIADELIFMNAKKDETSKQAYKLLVSLHNECGEIVKIVSDIGFIDRECRNLQELIDNETSKEIAVKLKRLNEDLKLIKEENTNLIQQMK